MAEERTGRRIPIIATVVVAAAVAVMIALGFWQLERKGEKEALLARYEAAQASGAQVAFPGIPPEVDDALYHKSEVTCVVVRSVNSVAGRNALGDAGFAHVVTCQDPEGSERQVVLGWSRSPATPPWAGGRVTGWIAPGPRLVADPPLAGLAANARPDPGTIPNNHLAYALQWFFFALTAVVIYVLALRRRGR